MKRVGRSNDVYGGQSGLRAFFQGLTNRNYQYNSSRLAYDVGEVYLNKNTRYYCNYYGIYPSYSQTSTRAISKSVLTDYPNLVVGLLIFDEKNNCYPGALFNYRSGGRIAGSLLALGLTRTPDIRLTAIGVLSYYKPRLHPLDYTAVNATRLVVLQLGQVGGV
uniref:Uncharacterized protein n=1 Tax=Fervidobacterium pennivorans TaxID=93466 RepID=A0A7C4RXC1_FERPE